MSDNDFVSFEDDLDQEDLASHRAHRCTPQEAKKRAGGQYPPARSYIYRSTRKTRPRPLKRGFWPARRREAMRTRCT